MSRSTRARVYPANTSCQVISLLRCGAATLIFSLLACATSTRLARAGDAARFIEWNAPPECPNQASVMSRVSRQIADASMPAHLRAKARVTQHAGTYSANVSIDTAQGAGERTLEHGDCAVLADSVALVIALTATQPEDDRRSTLRLALALHGAAVSGTLPRLAWGTGADLALEGLGALRTELSATWFLAQDVRYSDAAAIGASFQLLRIAGRVCREWSVAALDLAPCLGVQLYRLAADGSGGTQRSAGAANTIAPTLGVFLRLHLLRQLAVRLTLEAAVPFERRRFVYTDLGLLHRPDALTAQLFIAPELLF